MPKSQYMIRVSGLGNVRTLFLPHAQSDYDARGTIRVCEKSDPRMRVQELYRVECLLDELGDGKDYLRIATTTGKYGTCTYLVTGKHGKDLRDAFFEAPGPLDAILEARSLRWSAIRLYQCENIAL